MKKKPRILYIITQGHGGGAQKYILDLTNNVDHVFDCRVAIGEPKGARDLHRQLSVPKIRLRHLVRRIAPLHDLLAVFELAKLYTTYKPDIVHLNSTKTGVIGSIARLFSAHKKLRIVYTAHGWVFNEPLSPFRKKIYHFLEKCSARFKDSIIVLSPQDKTTAKQTLHIPSKKLKHIELGITSYKQQHSAQQVRARLIKKTHLVLPSEADYLVGCVAGLYKTKGIEVLLEAWKHLPKNIHGVIIGDGPERNALQALKHKHKQHNIHFVGALNHAAQYMPGFDLLVLPSHKEGLPYTLLEALSQSVPALATRVGGVPSLISHNQTGFLVPPNQPHALAKEIQSALHNKKQLAHIAQAGKRKVETCFSLEIMIEKTTALYQSLLT